MASGAIRSSSPVSRARRSLLSSPADWREVGIDRIELLDGGEIGRVVLDDERAFTDPRGADAAADRRPDRRIVEIERARADVGLTGGDLGLGLRHRGDGDLVLRRGDGLRLGQVRPSAWPAGPARSSAAFAFSNAASAASSSTSNGLGSIW